MTVWSMVGIIGVERLDADASWSSLVAWWSGILVAAAVSAGALWRRVGLFLTADAVVIKRVVGSHSVLWADVVGVTVEYLSTGRQSGMHLAFFLNGRFAPVGCAGPLWSRRLPECLTSFLQAGFDIPVNPRPPWQDRAGRWRGELLDNDPLESIRSIRRAAVGPLTFEVQPIGQQFRVLIRRPPERETTETSPHHDTLDAAIEDAVTRISSALRAYESTKPQGAAPNERRTEPGGLS